MNSRPGAEAQGKQTVSAVVACPLEETGRHIEGLLGSVGISTTLTRDIESAFSVIRDEAPTLAIVQGFAIDDALLQWFRTMQDEPTRAIVISPNAELIDRIIVLELGADEILPEPVDDRLLMSRVKAVLRRAHIRSRDEVAITPAGWSVDTLTREAVSPQGDRVRLTPTELSLLDLFIRNRGAVINAQSASAALGTEGGAAFRNAASRLRRKLGTLKGAVNPIRNFQGIGYVYDP